MYSDASFIVSGSSVMDSKLDHLSKSSASVGPDLERCLRSTVFWRGGRKGVAGGDCIQNRLS